MGNTSSHPPTYYAPKDLHTPQRGWSISRKKGILRGDEWYANQIGYQPNARPVAYAPPYPPVPPQPYYTQIPQTFTYIQPYPAPPQGQYVFPGVMPMPQPGMQPVIPIAPPVIPQGIIPNVVYPPGTQPMTSSHGHTRQQQQQMQMPEPEPAPAPPVIPATPSPAPQLDPIMPFPEPQRTPQPPPLAPGRYGPTDPFPPRSHNPLPEPPTDLFEVNSPYRRLYHSLRENASGDPPIRNHAPHYQQHPPRMKKRKGILRALSQRLHVGRHRNSDDDSDDYDDRRRHQTPYIYAVPISSSPARTPARTPVRMPSPMPPTPPPPPSPQRQQPVRIERGGQLAGLVHFSPHPVHYAHKSYPTALHLFEALKFIEHRPDIAERLRKTPTQDVLNVSMSFGQHMRADWEQVAENMMDEALYYKFIQHPDLRAMLMNTGIAHIIYAESSDPAWGDGPLGQGANELGKSLVRVRDRLRLEGFTG